MTFPGSDSTQRTREVSCACKSLRISVAVLSGNAVTLPTRGMCGSTIPAWSTARLKSVCARVINGDVGGNAHRQLAHTADAGLSASWTARSRAGFDPEMTT